MQASCKVIACGCEVAYHIKLLQSTRVLNRRGPVVGDVENYYNEDDEVDGEDECESVK